jgi:hypothetical protein
MFLSSRNNQFRFEFPRKFIPEEVANKYRPFINKMPGSMIKEPIDLFNYGIQSMNLPGPTFEPVRQRDSPGSSRRYRTPPSQSTRPDKTMTLTMQSFDGFINYWMAIDIFESYFNKSGKEPFLNEGVGIQIMDGEGNLFVTANIREMLMTSVSALDLNFSSNTVEFQTFDINFEYNILDVTVNLA